MTTLNWDQFDGHEIAELSPQDVKKLIIPNRNKWRFKFSSGDINEYQLRLDNVDFRVFEAGEIIWAEVEL